MLGRSRRLQSPLLPTQEILQRPPPTVADDRLRALHRRDRAHGIAMVLGQPERATICRGQIDGVVLQVPSLVDEAIPKSSQDPSSSVAAILAPSVPLGNRVQLRLRPSCRVCRLCFVGGRQRGRSAIRTICRVLTLLFVLGSTLVAGAGGADAAWWHPTPGTSWQIQFTGKLDLNRDVNVWDLDLFDTSAGKIAKLHDKGRRVICYFSAGSLKDWRPDAASFPTSAIGAPLNDWEGEWWLDVRSGTVRKLMQKRLDLAVTKGCDAVDPDNVDGYANDTGFPLTASHQLNYNKFLASEAHKRGLAIGLKNDLDQIPKLAASFDFQINEHCFAFDECDLLEPFIEAGKPVFQIEYGSASRASRVCPRTNALNFDTLIKNLSLDAKRTACR